jgi:putative endonuclease
VSKSVGDAFEAHALVYLQRQRMRLVARNVTCRGGEIDLVMRDRDGALVFVEVRARKSRQYAGVVGSIGTQKRARLVRAAQHYLSTWRGEVPPCRFDVVAFDTGASYGLPMRFAPTKPEPAARVHACGKLRGA